MMKSFYQLGPVCYQIALKKEILRRHICDYFSNDKFAKEKSNNDFPYLWKSHSSLIVRKLFNVDIILQENKLVNIDIASKKINKLIVYPGEVFSFWKLVGKPTKNKGYLDGLVVTNKGLTKGVGGGICQMANMIHWLVLHTPLDVIEMHHHTDALFPDYERRVPFGTGTSVSYNAVDYRFKNNTDNPIQILTWCENGYLCGEIRGVSPLNKRYKIIEEDSHYKKEKDCFYRNSKVYKLTIDRNTNKELSKELILNNHSKVMYDHSLIPENEIVND